jgi:hypothetical protein
MRAVVLIVFAACSDRSATVVHGFDPARLRVDRFDGTRRLLVVADPSVRPDDVAPAGSAPDRATVPGWFTASLTYGEARQMLETDVGSSSKGIRRIVPVPDDARDRPLNDTVRARTRAEEVQGFALAGGAATYAGYSGAGWTALVFDAGLVAAHRDLAPRVLNPGPGDDHATSVAGIIAGDGDASELHGGTPYRWRGMAPEAEIVGNPGAAFLSAWQMSGWIFEDGVDASNSSLALSLDGSYDERSAAIDAVARGSAGRPHLAVIAAANNGLSAQHGVLRGYYSVLTTAKNAITVGALCADAENRWRGSSMGPTWDGRIAPLLLAPADWLTWPGNGRAVAIDFVRFEDDGGAVGFAMEFDDPGELTGWRTVQNVSDWEVAGGELRFNSEIVGIVISPDALGVDPAYHVLRARAKVAGWSDPRSRGALYEWGTAPYCDPGCAVWDAAAGSAWRAASAEDVWDEHVVDVGAAGVEWVRIRPYDGADHATYGPSFDPEDDTSYAEHGQTSMAAPVVTGGAILLLQALHESSGRDPDAQAVMASTARAILVDTAVDVVHEEAWIQDGRNPDTGVPPTFGAGPDFSSGFGRIDVAEAVATAEAGRWLEDAVREGETRVFEVRVPAGAARLTVTLAWDDPPADPDSDWEAPKLVHDLDVRVTDGGGFEALPWTIEPPPHEPLPSVDGVGPFDAATDLRGAVRDEDHRNPIEKVEVDAPPAGALRVEVRAADSLPQGPWQRFSLAASAPIANAADCEPTTEWCNGADDDCDGDADEGMEGLAEGCEGLDDDCDGSVDEGCACERARPCVVAATGCAGIQDCPDGRFGDCVTDPGCPEPEEDAGPGDDAGPAEDAGGEPDGGATPPRRGDAGCGCRASSTGDAPWTAFAAGIALAVLRSGRRALGR